MKYRKLTEKEILLIGYLAHKGHYLLDENWQHNTLVAPMEDGQMGSLYIVDNKKKIEKREFKEQISECTFKDADGITVVASLNIDKDNRLFEIDIWKVDFSPVIEISDRFDE